jgi:hypothetical protein
MKDLFYLAVRSDLVRPDLLKTPNAPSNYKDPAKIHEYVVAKKIELHAEASAAPVVACAKEIQLMNDDGDILFHAKSTAATPAAVKFLKFVHEAFPFTFSSVVVGADSRGSDQRFVGLCISNALKIIAADILTYNATHESELKLPVRLWYSPLVATDPLAILSNFSPKFLTTDTVASVFGVDLGLPAFDTSEVPIEVQIQQMPVETQCNVAQKITHTLQLFGS